MVWGGCSEKPPWDLRVCGVSEAEWWVQSSLKPPLPLEGIQGGLQGVGQTVLACPSIPGWIVWEEGMDSIISKPTQLAPDQFCGEKDQKRSHKGS